MINLKLIPDARQAWRFLSVRAAVVLAVLSAVQLDLLPLIQPLIDPAHWPYVSGSLALLIIVLRVLSQPGLQTKHTEDV